MSAVNNYYLDLVEIIVGNLNTGLNPIIRTGKQISSKLSIFRLIRTCRLVRTRPFQLLARIVDTLIFGFPTIINVLMLTILVYILFALIGCKFFKNASMSDGTSNSVYGFDNFHRAFMLLIRCSTGEDWGTVMYTYSSDPDRYYYGRIYFITFVMSTTMAMLVLLELVIVQIFENFYFNPENALSIYKEAKEDFDRTWNIFTVSTKGQKMHYLKLVRLFAHLQEPLGFRVLPSRFEDPIERVIILEEQFRIRKPISAIAIILAMSNLPV